MGLASNCQRARHSLVSPIENLSSGSGSLQDLPSRSFGASHLTTTYSVDPAARVVFTNISAPLTIRDLIALSDALRKDRSFDPTFDELLEVCPGSAVGFRYADVQEATKIDPFSKLSRRAILVHSDVDYGVARMYEVLHGGHIQVFRSAEKAREFLGLKSK